MSLYYISIFHCFRRSFLFYFNKIVQVPILPYINKIPASILAVLASAEFVFDGGLWLPTYIFFRGYQLCYQYDICHDQEDGCAAENAN